MNIVGFQTCLSTQITAIACRLIKLSIDRLSFQSILVARVDFSWEDDTIKCLARYMHVFIRSGLKESSTQLLKKSGKFSTG